VQVNVGTKQEKRVLAPHANYACLQPQQDLSGSVEVG